MTPCALAPRSVLAVITVGSVLGSTGTGIGGQRQRVAIARMLARDVELVIADEPSANLDQSLVGDVLAQFRTMPYRFPVVIVTHDNAMAAGSDRSIVLEPVPVARPEAAMTPHWHKTNCGDVALALETELPTQAQNPATLINVAGRSRNKPRGSSGI